MSDTPTSELSEQSCCSCLRVEYQPVDVWIDVAATEEHPAFAGHTKQDRWICRDCGCELVRAGHLAELEAEHAELHEHHEVALEELADLREGRENPSLGECSDELLRLCDENAGENYGAWTVYRDDQKWSLTIQREGGKTPAQIANDLEARLAAAEEHRQGLAADLVEQCDKLAAARTCNEILLRRNAKDVRERDAARGRLEEIRVTLATRSTHFYNKTVFDLIERLATDSEGGEEDVDDS